MKRRHQAPVESIIPLSTQSEPDDVQKVLEIMMKPKTVSVIIIFCAIFFLMQIYGLKYIFNAFTSPKLLEERPPWEAVKLLFEICERTGLPIFVIEPSLVRAVKEGSKLRLDMWNLEPHSVVAIGVQEAGLDEMHLVMSSMKREGYEFWEKVDPDPRGITLTSKKSYRSVASHFLLWVPVQSHTPMLIHMVVFYKRGEFFWHSGIYDNINSPPFNMSSALFGKTAGTIKTFDLATAYLDGIKVQYPNDTLEFLRNVATSEFIECNYTRALLYYAEFRMDQSPAAETFRRKARQLIHITKTVLDDMDIPFWLSSGTCLGWYRQCDLIPHSTDVDIGIFIKNYREEMISLLEYKGLKLVNRFGKTSDSFELSFHYGDLKLDIFFFYETKEYTWNGGTQASTGNKYKYIFPPFHLCWTEFLEMWLRIPCPTEPYIHANYGPKWMIPDTAWDWKKSPHNVIDNGKWPEEEWDEVIQLYETT